MKVKAIASLAVTANKLDCVKFDTPERRHAC